MLIRSGVKNTPKRLEMLALKIAAGMLPPAIDTITTLDDTVDGSEARKNVPSPQPVQVAPRVERAEKPHRTEHYQREKHERGNMHKQVELYVYKPRREFLPVEFQPVEKEYSRNAPCCDVAQRDSAKFGNTHRRRKFRKPD